MRIDKLSNDRIKVTLTTTDLIKLDIDVNDLSPENEALHSFLFHIMETVREETGFNPYSGQVVVEATPSNEGIILLVSKMKGSRQSAVDIRKGVSVKARRKRTETPALFYFKNFDDLCSGMCLLEEAELSGCALYKIGDTFCFSIKVPSAFKRCVAVMSEFAEKCSKYPAQLEYIKEHGELVARGEALVNMARNIRHLT